jgi:hypothetical protein
MTTPRARPPAPLPRHARAMLAAYREANEIPAAVEDRIWSVVGADDAPAPAFDPLEAPAPPRTNVRAIGWAGGMLAAAAVLVLAWQQGGLLAERRRAASAPGAAVMQGGGDPSQGRASAGTATQRSSEPATITPDAPSSPDPAPHDPTVVGGRTTSSAEDRRRSPPDAAEPEPEPTASSTLAAELALVTRARRALTLGETARALDATAEHARRFPHGVLAPERAAIETIARCRQGGQGDPDRARAFHRAHPRSLFAELVDEACGAAPREKPSRP